jgi:hypothetical protein
LFHRTTNEEGEMPDDRHEHREHRDGDRHEDRDEDRWRIWRMIEAEREYVRTMARARRPRGLRDLGTRRRGRV